MLFVGNRTPYKPSLLPQRKVLTDLFLQTACSTINLLALYPVIKAPTQPWQLAKNFIAASIKSLWKTVKRHVVFLVLLFFHVSTNEIFKMEMVEFLSKPKIHDLWINALLHFAA